MNEPEQLSLLAIPPTEPPTAAPIDPRTGQPMTPKTLEAKKNNRHHLERCPDPKCPGLLESKTPRGNLWRYACNTPYPGADRKHWWYYTNDEVLRKPTRDHNRNHKIPNLACPYCGSGEYDFGTASKDGSIQHYWCRNKACSEDFIVQPGPDGEYQTRQRAKTEPDNANPRCPNCGSRRNGPARRSPRRVSALELVDDRLCKECGYGWAQSYDLRRADDEPTRPCAYCGKPIEGRGKRARFCSDRHQRYAQELERRKRRQREASAKRKKVGGRVGG